MLRKMKRAIIRGNNSGKYLHSAWADMMFKKLTKALKLAENEPSKIREGIRLALIKRTQFS